MAELYENEQRPPRAVLISVDTGDFDAEQSLDELVRKMAETALDPAGQTVFISHGDCLADAQYVEKRIRETLGVKKFYINFIGPVIGAHSGPGTVALFFLGPHR